MPKKYELAAVSGVRKAFDLHLKFTGGLPLTQAPEAFIQGQIALALNKLGLYVTLESKVYQTLVEAGAEMRGRPIKRGAGRLDLVSWWKKGTPRHLIEVKKLRHKDASKEDAERIRKLLRRGTTLRDGLLVVYADAKKPDTVTKRIDYVVAQKGLTLGVRSGVVEFTSKLDNGATWYYEAAAIRVK